ncbi:MAG: sensor histidine kinase [Candidatus Dormibacteria bacterium]
MPAILLRTRVRLTLTYAGASTVLALGGVIAFWIVFAHLQAATIDRTLTTQAQAIVAGLNTGQGPPQFGDGPLPGETASGVAVLALLVARDGRIVDQSGNAPHVKAFARAAHRGPLSGDPVTRTIAHRQERILLRPVGSGPARVVLLLARPISELDQTLAETALLLAVVALVLVAGAAGLGYWVAGRALKPVRQMAATVRAITEHDLGQRVQLDLPAGDELGELAHTFNGMLDRLEEAFASLRRLTADAAHELRTPLTLMRSQAEVTLRHAHSTEDHRAGLRTILTEIEGLGRTADQLLLLARADAGSLTAARDPIELGDLVEEVVARWGTIAARRQVRVRATVAGDGDMYGDKDLLRRCLDNLIDNGVRHSPAGGLVRVTTECSDGWWTITVQDTGSGVDPGLRARIFERFTRGDPARGRDTGGAGLGLALCVEIAQAHGGTISLVETAVGGGAGFALRLPTGGPHR